MKNLTVNILFAVGRYFCLCLRNNESIKKNFTILKCMIQALLKFWSSVIATFNPVKDVRGRK